jgi:TorA maturation chaperone TorD
MNKEAVNGARSLYYGLLSKMLVFTEDPHRFDGLAEALDVMITNPIDANSAEALKEILAYLEAGHAEAITDEYDAIFHDPESPIVRTTASYYDEGVESGKKRLEVKNFLAKTRLRRDESHYKEPEDSIGFLVTFMHELVELIIAGEESYDTLQHCLFAEVINEFIDRLIVELYEHPEANIYKSLAVVMAAFTAFERLYFNVEKPKAKEKISKQAEDCEFISDTEAKRRAQNRIEKNAESLVKSCALEDDAFEDEAGISQM